MQDASVRDSSDLKRSPGRGGWTAKGGHSGGGVARPGPHPPAAASSPQSPAPLSGAPRPPFDAWPGPPAISALRLPTHSVPGIQTLSEAGARQGRCTGRLRARARRRHTAWDSPTRDTPGAQVLPGRAAGLSRDTSLRPLPTPAPAACWQSVGTGTEKLQERGCRAGRGMQGRPGHLAPKPKGVRVCSQQCHPCHPKGQQHSVPGLTNK